MSNPNVPVSVEELRRRFNHWPPQDSTAAGVHMLVRDTLCDAATVLIRYVPPGRQQSLMLTALEEAMHWANAGIAYQRAMDAQTQRAAQSTAFPWIAVDTVS